MGRLFRFPSLKIPASKRRSIILLFVVGIVLPSVLLGYLAFRGVQNDRALLEKESLDESRRIAGLVVREVDEKIAADEAALASAVGNLEAVDSGAQGLTTILDKFEAGHTLVEEVFILRGLEEIRFPAAKLLYLGDSSPPAGSARPLSSSSSLAAGIRRAEDQEFRRKNFPQAQRAYLRILDQTDDSQLEGEILNAVARVQKKAALFAEAAATYERITRDYSDVVSPVGIPLGVAARLELGSLFADGGDFARSLEILMDLYGSLLQRKWLMRRAEFEFFLERTKSRLREFFSSPPPGLDLAPLRNDFATLERKEGTQRQWTERIIAFEEGALPGLEGKIGGVGEEPGRSPRRLVLDIGRRYYLISVGAQAFQNTGRSGERLGIIFDAERLKEDILHPALLRHVSSRETSWIVKGRDGAILLTSDSAPSGAVAVRTDFASNFPDWTLEFHQKPPDLVKTFLASRHGVYSYMFLLIAGILVFGLALTIRTVSRELELAKMKSDFVSTISHEFKSPLTSIRQLAEMLHSGRVPSEERRQKYYDVLLEQSERLSLLTDNILSLARIEEGRKEFRFEATDLAELLRENVSSIQDRVGHEGFDIEIEAVEAGDAGLIAEIDREAVSQALANLLDNAVKYSGESRKVIVRLFVENENAVINVRDFGVGIRADELSKVFDRFYRGGDELTRTIKGTGLGLSLVKEVVEAHRGRVSAKSGPGKGSTFSIRLPLKRPEEG